MEQPKKENNRFSTIKKFITWKRITGVATILSLIVAIWVLIPESRAKRLKKEITYNIEIIENDFHPKELLFKNDSSHYLNKLAEFEQLALDYCSILSTVNNYQDYTEFSDMEFEEARTTVGIDLMRIAKADTLSYECLMVLDDLVEYAQKLDYDYIGNLSVSKRADIKEYMELKKKVSMKYLGKYTELMNKYLYAKSVHALNTDDFIGFALKEINKLVDDADFFKYNNAVLNYFIDADKLFKISKRHFVQVERSQKQ